VGIDLQEVIHDFEAVANKPVARLMQAEANELQKIGAQLRLTWRFESGCPPGATFTPGVAP
jgi:hypothetical protein